RPPATSSTPGPLRDTPRPASAGSAQSQRTRPARSAGAQDPLLTHRPRQVLGQVDALVGAAPKDVLYPLGGHRLRIALQRPVADQGCALPSVAPEVVP